MHTDETSAAHRREFLSGLARTVTGAGLLTTGALALDATSAAAATTDTVYDKGGAVFNIRGYGAAPGTDSTSAIQQAIDAAAVDGGCVWVPAGVYPCGKLFLKPGAIIDGVGTLKLVSATTVSIWIQASTQSTPGPIGIRNITLDANFAGNASLQNALRLTSLDGLVLEGVTIRNGGKGTTASIANCSNGWIDRLAVIGAASTGIGISGTGLQVGSISARKCNSVNVGAGAAIVLTLTDSTVAQVLATDNAPPTGVDGIGGVRIDNALNTSFGEIVAARNGLSPNTKGHGLCVWYSAHCSFGNVNLQDNGYHGLYTRKMNCCSFASLSIKGGADYPCGLFESADNTFASVTALVSEFASEGIILVRQGGQTEACDRNTFGQVNLIGEWNTSAQRGLIKPVVLSDAHDNVFHAIRATGAGHSTDPTMVFGVALEVGASRNTFSDITAIGSKASYVAGSKGRCTLGDYGAGLATDNVVRIDAGCKDNVFRNVPTCGGVLGSSMVVSDKGSGTRWGTGATTAAAGRAGKWYASPASQVFVPGVSYNDYLQVSPITFSRPVTLQKLGMRVAAAGSRGSKFRLGIYADDNGMPGALLFDSGKSGSTIDGTVASSSITSVPCTKSLLPGTYWIGGVLQGATGTGPKALRHTGGGAVEIRESDPDALTCAYEQGGVSGALPTTFSPMPSPPFDCIRTFVQVAS